MKLLRLTSNNNNGVVDVNFNEDIRIESDSKISLLNTSFSVNKKEFLDWGIQGFPTIIFRKNTNAIEYNVNRDIKSISKFCNEMKKIK